MRLYPSVIWALDDLAGSVVQRWYASVDRDTRTFVHCASDASGVYSAMRDFGDSSFAAKLLRLGIEPPEGHRMSVVLVAYAIGKQAFTDWGRVNRELDLVQRETLECRTTYVLIGRTREHIPAADGYMALGNLSQTPWVVTDRLHRAETLDETAFQSAVGLLLRGLVMCEGEEHRQGPSVFRLPQRPGSICLLALPVGDLDVLAAEVSDLVAQSLVFRSRERTSASPPLPRELLRRVETSCNALLLGQLLPDAFLAAVLGSDGLASSDVRTILTDGPDLVRRAKTRVSLQLTESATGQEAPRLRWLQRMMIWVGRRLGLVLGPATNEPGVRLLQIERDYVLARLGEAEDLLIELVSSGGARERVARFPVEVLESLRPALHRLLAEELRVLSREIPGSSRTPEDLMRALATHLRPLVESDLGQILAEWGIDTEQARVFREALKDEKRLRFAAYRPGGLTPGLHAFAASSQLPRDFGPVEKLRPWRSAGFVAFGASQPISADFFGVPPSTSVGWTV